jgi:hypothetical protein
METVTLRRPFRPWLRFHGQEGSDLLIQTLKFRGSICIRTSYDNPFGYRV